MSKIHRVTIKRTVNAQKVVTGLMSADVGKIMSGNQQWDNLYNGVPPVGLVNGGWSDYEFYFTDLAMTTFNIQNLANIVASKFPSDENPTPDVRSRDYTNIDKEDIVHEDQYQVVLYK